jgi:NADPH2:quinone reductase
VKAWVVRTNGAPESMSFEHVPDVETPDGMLRIAVGAAAINFFDSLLVAGTYQQKPELPFIPGVEIAGTVVEGPDGSGFSPGDRVFAQLRTEGIRGGGYAETAFARPQETLPMPDSMSLEQAAAFFVNYQTGWFGLHRRAKLQPGEFLLVHAAAGGVGSAAVQLGKAAGATVIASVGSPEKARVAAELGADRMIERNQEDLVQAVKDFTKGHGADVVFDPVGGEAFERSTKCIAFEGRIVVVGFTSGQIPQARANHVLVKNYSVVGLHWGLYQERKPELIGECTRELLRLHAQGRIAPYVSRRVPLEGAAEALSEVAAGKTTGKTVIVPAMRLP